MKQTSRGEGVFLKRQESKKVRIISIKYKEIKRDVIRDLRCIVLSNRISNSKEVSHLPTDDSPFVHELFTNN